MRTGVGSVTFPDKGRIRGHNVINSERNSRFSYYINFFCHLGQLNPLFFKIHYAYMIG